MTPQQPLEVSTANVRAEPDSGLDLVRSGLTRAEDHSDAVRSWTSREAYLRRSDQIFHPP